MNAEEEHADDTTAGVAAPAAVPESAVPHGRGRTGAFVLTLRLKLLLIALAAVVLPLAGWVYLRQMDQVLRQSQERALEASARVLAGSIAAIADLPAPPAWHVQSAPDPLVVDGYADDWSTLSRGSQPFAKGGHLMLAADGGWLYAMAEVADATRDRSATDGLRRTDHVSLALRLGRATCRYEFAAAAPGGIAAMPQAGAAEECPQPLSAQWQENGSGYRLEWRLPSTPLLTALGIAAFDASAPAVAAVDLHPVLRYAPSLARRLDGLAPPGTRVRLIDAGGWVIADTGSIATVRGSGAGWLSSLLYRGLVSGATQGSPSLDRDTPRLDAGEVWQALSGVPAASWRSTMSRGGVTLATAVPLPAALGDPRGALLLEEGSRAMPLLANRGLLSMLLASFGLLLAAGVALGIFAIRLGLRIGGLRNAVDHAVAYGGATSTGILPGIADRDEIGDLARGFDALLEASRQHADYLRTLASKLSHELNTPLAIVKSSLDNLDASGLDDAARSYAARARDGAERLSQLLRAMGAANRVERAIAAAEPEDFDLRVLVAGCADGYRLLAGERRFELELPPTPISMHGAPELLAQALDKLFENALSFTPDDGWIRLSLRANPHGADIELANQGRPLPAGLEGRLFDSLVGARDSGDTHGTPHLGLGLYIVRLVAEQHGGRASARNLDDGVVFTLDLFGMPRRPAGAARA